ncbi:MAG TPA: M64 family metallopeptidase [Planctomycetota bacterium]|nr:M64 family metallopeptidase [Planctomycetota bacterium]
MSTRALLALVGLAGFACLAPAQEGANAFDERFTGRSLRFDYHHAGTASEEHVAPDALRLEGPWPGSRTRLVDDTGMGKYRFAVVDPASGELLYSRGFASIYGEWETTAEARAQWRVFHESQRFPEPRAPVELVLEKRGADGSFAEIWRQVIDPASRFVDRSALSGDVAVHALFENGPPATQVDLLIVAEGYTRDMQARFVADAQRLTDVMFATEPFARRRDDFSVRALFVPSPEAGIPNPRRNEWPASALGLSFNAFDSDRYVLTYANQTLREVAAHAPYDALIVLFAGRKYGGGGIFNLWSTCASDSAEAPYLFVHEFGHSFGGLADEYYTSPVSYEDFVAPGTEPWEPNVTALLDPAKLKWRDLVASDTPLPTPWGKETYDTLSREQQAVRAEKIAAGASEEEMEALFREVKAVTKPMLEGERYFGEVGAFEGAAYEAHGLYRPEVDCIMFTRNPTSFCKVCERGLERVIDLYAQ